MTQNNEKDPDLMKVTYYFSGYVKSNSYKSITDGIVEVNMGEFNSDKIFKRTTTTDKNGYFKLGIQTNVMKPRFVLNIWKEGYGLFSQIFFRGKQNGTWLLTKGTIHTIDPRKDNTIRDTPHITKYTGPLSSHIDLSKISYRRLLRADKTAAIKKLLQSTPSYLDPQVIHGIRNKGIQVTIMGDTLVDSNGQPPAGLVNVTLATVDILGPDSMPGDFTAAFKDEKGNDQIGYMITYGAGSVDVLANGKKYQLKPGSKAKIEIPLPKHLEGSNSIPKEIPFLEYNKEKGIWEEIGEGTFNENTQVYVATTTQFSSFNMDILKTDQACLVINGIGIKKDYRLEVAFEYPPNSGVRTRNKYPNANDIYALYNLAPDIPYTLTAYKTDLTYPLWIASTVCTPTPQDPAPNKPVPDQNFTFPVCHHSSSDLNPVILCATPPLPPTEFSAEQIGCNDIDLLWAGSAEGPEEGYKIKVYQNVGDINPLFEYTASYQDIRFRVEGLVPNTTYYIQIHQYDEYAEEDSESCPDCPLIVTTGDFQTFTITNQICDYKITQVRFNDETEDQSLPPGGLGYTDQQNYSVCKKPNSVQVTAGPYSYDFRTNFSDSIIVRELVEILNVGDVWGTNQIPPGTPSTLEFQDGSFNLNNDNANDRGEYQETGQGCIVGKIYFTMSFEVLEEDLNCEYLYPTDTDPAKIIILSYPTVPPRRVEFLIV